jgi:ribosomal protein S18 acetylase RimI-like enzyme
MNELIVRPMTGDEYAHWQQDLAEDYAAEKVAVGAWPADGAVERALESNSAMLPEGLETPRMLLLQAVDRDGATVGRAWVALDHPQGGPDCAFLYDIEISADRRGQGFGRALLNAVEQEVRKAGIGSLELNVFGTNRVAVTLYSSSGYTVATQQMRKRLDDQVG